MTHSQPEDEPLGLSTEAAVLEVRRSGVLAYDQLRLMGYPEEDIMDAFRRGIEEGLLKSGESARYPWVVVGK